jgi:predicted nucleotidyltransferase
MSSSPEHATGELPSTTKVLLEQLVRSARDCFSDDLKSMVLFGSGAEGRLRLTSDLNLLIILKRFDKGRVDSFREPLRLAQVTARASVMFLLEKELAEAAEAFAVKFADIVQRHRVLYGEDLVSNLTTSRAARKLRLRQVLLNLTFRLRERYATTSLREEHLAIVVAEAAGPLRAAAAALCELEGHAAGSPREALERVAGSVGGEGCTQLLEALTEARQSRALPAGIGPVAVFQLINLCEAARLRLERIE